MQLGVNVPNFGPGTDPGVLREWARTVEGLGFDLLMVSDHVAVTPDVAERYPEPFYEPFTTLSWLAGITTGLRLGTTVLVLPYRHPLLVARMATNLQQLSGGRFVLGVGVGWARQEFEALGVPFTRRGKLTDAYLGTLRDTWRAQAETTTTAAVSAPVHDQVHDPIPAPVHDQVHDPIPASVHTPVPVWVGGHSEAAIRRTVRFGDAWHPLRLPLARMRSVLSEHSLPAFAPRIALRLTDKPVDDPERPAGVGTVEQILDDLEQLRLLGADTVVFDPYHGDPEETRRPDQAWQALTAVATRWRSAS
ncbi:TIGR03619 family F420-dependent LLM class oxidoreductase [Streptomyces sp. NBC_00572]|uniref:TIGR03619 family F420-dependent LLM class oxidoreductase n=1 Tax=Streptomyces sp. NBC_00572 TaxID=2903664 RepID=UPI0022532FC8|nr:TIGR03619 family F420-dependent LLM class oxidoreductase [Streptomyces sp. NBC_00572]MCX4982650.1 TIGR03619 family F420-dependent LLM class oxidoreductase [Streptomyces sp. NBC_00572]